MTQNTAVSMNANGSFSLYAGGKKIRSFTGAGELIQFLQGPDAPVATRKPKREKPKSRSARWSDAASTASAALSDLRDIQSEFEEWRDGLPENLENSPVGEKLQAVCDIDLQSALEAVEEAESADLPLGFGRD